MSPATAEHLMQSIAANRLTVLCGAGLSMAPPSSAPSAAAIATECATKYHRTVGTALDAGVADNIEEMARWFRNEHRFADLFINTLVPWHRFNRPPNPGHAAIADFLACGAMIAGLTTNYDRMVEQAAQNLGEPDFQPITDVGDLARTYAHSPYLKVHGCCVSGTTRGETIWCSEQLTDPPIQNRLNHFQTWLQSNLLDRDILIVGFWSDWSYLTDIFTTAINAIGPRSVFVIDPSPAADLQLKAPLLWAWANRDGVEFHHEQESGADFLNSFREHFSRVFLRQLFADAGPTYQTLFTTPPIDQSPSLDGQDVDQLYALRRDLTAVPRNRPVRHRQSQPEYRVHTAIHLRLIALGAPYNGHTYSFGGKVIRVINGAGRLMSDVKQEYHEEPPLLTSPTEVICVGVIADPTPASVVRPDEEPSFIRSGIAGNWTTADALLQDLRAPNV